MTTVILVIHVLAAVLLVGLVLIQQGQGADAGAAFGSGSSQTVFGARGAGSFLTRATTGLAIAFFATSLTLAYFANTGEKAVSVTDRVAVPAGGAVGQRQDPPAGPLDGRDVQNSGREAPQGLPAIPD